MDYSEKPGQMAGLFVWGGISSAEHREVYLYSRIRILPWKAGFVGGKSGLRSLPLCAVVPRATGTHRLDHDAIRWNRIMISSLCLSMIFSENRFPLFRIML
jgi:hypothetical protein